MRPARVSIAFLLCVLAVSLGNLSSKDIPISLWLSTSVIIWLVSEPISRWLMGELSAIDPEALLALFSAHFFALTPLYQFVNEYYPYLPWDIVTDQWVPIWFVLNAAVLCVIFPMIRAVRQTSVRSHDETVLVSNLWNDPSVRLTVKQVAGWFFFLALILKLLVLYKLGGISGMLSAYQQRIDLGGTQFNPLSGIGPIVFISDDAPVAGTLWLIAHYMLKVRGQLTNTRLATWILAVGIPVSFIYVGLIGSRSNTVYTAFLILAYVSLFITPITARKIIVASVIMVAFMNVYMAYKFGGIEAVFDPRAREAAFAKKQLDSPLEFLAVRDFGRMDVQVIALREMFQEQYPAALGRSYLGGVAAIFPSALFPNRPESFTLEKTEIVFPGMSLTPEIETTLVFGGAGEAWVNWKWGAILMVVPYLLIVRFCVCRFRSPPHSAWDRLLYPVYSIAPIALLIYDSNSLMYFLAQFAVCPFLISMAVRRTVRMRDRKPVV